MKHTYNPNHTRAVIMHGGKPYKPEMYSCIQSDPLYRIMEQQQLTERCMILDQIFNCRTAQQEKQELRKMRYDLNAKIRSN